MTNAPTTRETADHAELLAKLANDMRKFEHHAVGSLRIDMDEVRKVIAACDSHAALLSEIAALRGERTFLVDQKEGAEDAIFDALSRATQAERQRDELRKALGLAAKRFETLRDLTDHVPHRIACSTWADEARQANQGADQ